MKIFRSVNASLGQGSVDHISVAGVRGWCSTPGPVRIKVNGQERLRAFCQVERRDVQAVIGGESMVGFNVPLPLSPGDVVEVTTHCRKLLPGSPQRVSSNTWLSTEAVKYPAFASIASVVSAAHASHFQPFFRRNVELAAVALRVPDQPDRLVKLNCNAAHRRDVQAFYQHVITPFSLPAPALLPLSGWEGVHQSCLYYHYIEGRSYAAASLLPEQARRDVIHTLGKLHSISIGNLRRLNSQQPYWVYLQRHIGRQALLSCDIGYIKMLLAMRRCIRKLPVVLSHGDLHTGNVLVDATTGHVTLIDWDRWGELPLGYDEACFLRGIPFRQALAYLPDQRDLRLGFTIVSYWLGASQSPQFRHSDEAEEMSHYFYKYRARALLARSVK